VICRAKSGLGARVLGVAVQLQSRLGGRLCEFSINGPDN
jgi:hypothetical protein